MPDSYASLAGTQATTLRLEFVSSRPLELRGIRTSDLVTPLNAASWICGVAYAAGADPLLSAKPLDELAEQFEPELVRVEFGSPLVLMFGLAEELAFHVASAAFLIYGLKRIWGLDLELKAHRAELQSRFYMAQRKVRDLTESADSIAKTPKRRLSQRKENFSTLDASAGWRRGTAEGTERMRERSGDWSGIEADWRADD